MFNTSRSMSFEKWNYLILSRKHCGRVSTRALNRAKELAVHWQGIKNSESSIEAPNP